jgi:ribosomal protein S19
MILNEKVIYVHNGKDYMQMKISFQRKGHKFGEFAITKVLENKSKSKKSKKKK